jgi:hypothetical protein
MQFVQLFNVNHFKCPIGFVFACFQNIMFRKIVVNSLAYSEFVYWEIPMQN